MLLQGLDAQLRGQILAQQYLARRRGYHAAFPEAEERIVLAAETPVGAIITERKSPDTHLVDIALLSQAQGAGVGTTVLRRLIGEADAEHHGVSLSVDPANHRARRLYRRLGFAVTAAGPTEIAMRRPPSRQRADGACGDSGR